jgi:hypothetical protein
MENDRELLELAAKAAGHEHVWKYGPDMLLCWSGEPMKSPDKPWNPLTDDGDALRLAVKLNLELGFGVEGRVYSFLRGHEGAGEDIPPGSDPYAATRRAIVRAAAAIGKANP